MKTLKILVSFSMLLLTACQTLNADEFGLESQVIINYQSTNTLFPNPERGFFVQRFGWNKIFNPEWDGLTLEDMQQARRDGYSLVRAYYLIPEFKGGSLSQEFLDTFEQHLTDARRAGVKLIPLFAYSWPSNPDYANHPQRPENQDAPLSDVLRHLEQLQAIISQNVDVIAMWDAGFIGPWGEWHTSTNGLIGEVTGREVNSKTRRITNKLLEIIPTVRMITLRTPRYKQQLTGTQALSSTEAFNGSAKARLGAKNDCFLASKTNAGTYLPDDDVSIQASKDFLHQDNLFLPQQGETCYAGASAQTYIKCPNALAELEYLRYSTLNISYHPDVIQRWRNGGCFNEISRRLGYRFELVSSSVPTRLTQRQNLQMSFVVRNVGFANPYNPRGLAVILRNKATAQTYRITLANGNSIPSNRTYDPRFWQPGTTTTVSINRTLPTGLAKGEYEVLLHLFDPAPALQGRSAYAIRFANVGTWESTTGYNQLLQTLTVR